MNGPGFLAALTLLAGAALAEPYAPMAPFAAHAGKTWACTGTGPDGSAVEDLARWEFILGGRALQTTHHLTGADYGGTTIFFYDESAKSYLFHYFTNAGFHTQGTMTLEDGVFVAEEAVTGVENIDRIVSRLILTEGRIRTESESFLKGASLGTNGFDCIEAPGKMPRF
jgi:hypothetical protein